MKKSDQYSVEMKRRRLLLSIFQARLVREFGETSRTVNDPQDPTCATSTKGFILIPHPAIGEIHLKVDLNEAFGVYCLELKNVELAEIPEAMQAEPSVWDGVGDEELEAMLDIDTLLFEVIEWVLTEPYVKYQKQPFTFVQMMHAEYC